MLEKQNIYGQQVWNQAFINIRGRSFKAITLFRKHPTIILFQYDEQLNLKSTAIRTADRKSSVLYLYTNYMKKLSSQILKIIYHKYRIIILNIYANTPYIFITGCTRIKIYNSQISVHFKRSERILKSFNIIKDQLLLQMHF